MARHDLILRPDGARATLRRHARALAAGVALMVLAGGCASDAGTPTHTVDPSRLFWSLTVDHHAVTLSLVPPYDTLQLTATAWTATGVPLSDGPKPRFHSTDVERVLVDSTGLLHAMKVSTAIAVVAVDTVDDVVHSDTVWVNVTDVATPPVLSTLSIHPVPPDSAVFPMGGTLFESQRVLTAQVTDGGGNPIDGLVVHYASTDPTVAVIDALTGAMSTYRVGPVTFIASATAYGVTKADTLPYTISLPVQEQLYVEARTDAHGEAVLVFPPAPILIGVGGYVAWINMTSLPIDVVFDDPTNVAQDDDLCALFGSVFCGSGNIPSWSADPSGDPFASARVRQFWVPGTYHYHSALYGTTGTIIVQ